MERYKAVYQQLNAGQKKAVDTIDGPLLVLAGPGTGKTFVLTTRIAHILATTDTLPQNILCLTFTESGAHVMRERLNDLIGPLAFDVTINTYHAFGRDLLQRFPDYLIETADARPIDDLGVDQLLRSIIDDLPYSSPFKSAGLYLNDLMTFISEAKRSLLTPNDIKKTAQANLTALTDVNPLVKQRLGNIERINKTSLPMFANFLKDLSQKVNNYGDQDSPRQLLKIMEEELSQSLEAVESSGKTTALSGWKKNWLATDGKGEIVLSGQAVNQKLIAVANIYQQYLDRLKAQKLFDYDDMILKAVAAMKENPELRYNLQEQYQYILLDEFQDTNGAQLKLIELLSNNPVSEGRPNIMAVGDDDQAIYAFQGADYSHMLAFGQMYKDVAIVSLTDNYRSTSHILNLAEKVADQIDERLHHHLPNVTKSLKAAGPSKSSEITIVERREGKSEVSELAWTANKIKELIKSGVPASQIAVLAPKHRHLEPLVPFLHLKKIPVRYEKRENILDDPTISELVLMSRLCLALGNSNQPEIDQLWPKVLALDFWAIPTSLIWQTSWQASETGTGWTNQLLVNPTTRPIALFFIRLSQLLEGESLETILDYLIGVCPLELHEKDLTSYSSPFYAYYANKAPATFWQILSNLTVLRSRLRDYRPEASSLTLPDLIGFIEDHQNAQIKVLNSNPHFEADEAVQIMTTFKSKGQEFQVVFLLGLSDENWGQKARNQTSRIALPPNLKYMRRGTANHDERLRLLFVAMTRARTQLYLMSYGSSFSGKPLTHLRYLNEHQDSKGTWVSPLLPKQNQPILLTGESSHLSTAELTAYWQTAPKEFKLNTQLIDLLRPRLDQFQLSPTHVISFTDIINAGPESFFRQTLLKFPAATTPQSQFGSAIHKTLEDIHYHFVRENKLPDIKLIRTTYTKHLVSQRLNPVVFEQLLARGYDVLENYIRTRGQTISKDNKVEYNFKHEQIFLGKAHLSGKIDKLIIDEANKTMTVVDFKTGKSHSRWTRTDRPERYKLQLYLYKTLVEQSRTFAGYKVTDAYLEFVEAAENGRIEELHLDFNPEDQERYKKLTVSVWQHIQSLQMPDTSRYTRDLKGMEEFQRDLIDGKI